VAIKAEFHTNRNIKIKGDENENDGEHNAAHNESNGDTSNVDEVKELNFQEKARLHELYEASRSLSCPLEQDKDLHASATAEPNNLISVINLTDLAIKKDNQNGKANLSFHQYVPRRSNSLVERRMH